MNCAVLYASNSTATWCSLLLTDQSMFFAVGIGFGYSKNKNQTSQIIATMLAAGATHKHPSPTYIL
jgi:hypothetical protein